MLQATKERLRVGGITLGGIEARYNQDTSPRNAFQKVALDIIVQTMEEPYLFEARLRHKILFFNPAGIPARLERQAMRNFKYIPDRVWTIAKPMGGPHPRNMGIRMWGPHPINYLWVVFRQVLTLF